MPYEAEISRHNPTCFLLLIDQSGSMADPFGADPNMVKAHGVANAVNNLLLTLVYRCTMGETVLDRYYVGVIGYGGEPDKKDAVGFALGGNLTGQTLVPISQVAANCIRIEEYTQQVPDGAGGWFEQRLQRPIWFEPKAGGGTPMCAALRLARETLAQFLAQKAHQACFPPIVMNITDGESTDGDPLPEALALQALQSHDGNVLLFNLHISSRPGRAIYFPWSEEGLPDAYAQHLFHMSSVLPPSLAQEALSQEYPIREGSSRGFVFNADLESIIYFLDIGTRVDMWR